MKKKVLQILAEHPKARDNDTYLQWLVLRDYLKAQGFDLPWIDYEAFIRILTFKFETVRRVRQKIQESGQYPPSDIVAARRNRKEAAVSHWAVREKPGSW